MNGNTQSKSCQLRGAQLFATVCPELAKEDEDGRPPGLQPVGGQMDRNAELESTASILLPASTSKGGVR